VDGFSLSRNSKKEGSLKIFLVLKPDPPRFYPARELLEIFQLEDMSYSLNSILHRVWNYIKFHNLQDLQDKKMINCDSKLTNLFGGLDRINFYDVISKIKEFLIPIEPIEVDYTIMSNDKNEIYLDISIEMEDPVQSEITSFITDEPTKDIQELNSTIAQGIQKIKEHKKRREMFLEFSENPVEFIDKMIFSQTRDLLLMHDHKEKETSRNSSFFEEPWVQEAMERYLERK
jgi:SWI/SNF-related matrix-associated actin-dependent regulator of chromatin subfamily D